MTDDKLAIALTLRAAVAAKDPQRLAQAAEAIDREAFDRGSYTEQTFDALVATLRSQAFAALPDSLPLIKPLEYQLDLLAPEQREVLVEALTHAVPRLADDMAAFVAVELLVELGPPARVRETLERMTSGARGSLLLIVVHGWDWLAKRADAADSARAAALVALASLARNNDPQVAGEAQAALGRRTRA